MKKEFKVGDLVRVYDSRFIPWATKIIAVRESCILPMYLVNVGGIEYWVYPQQCRRLVKKQRREWWIAMHPCSRPSVHAQYNPDMICGSGCKIEWYRVREVCK